MWKELVGGSGARVPVEIVIYQTPEDGWDRWNYFLLLLPHLFFVHNKNIGLDILKKSEDWCKKINENTGLDFSLKIQFFFF